MRNSRMVAFSVALLLSACAAGPQLTEGDPETLYRMAQAAAEDGRGEEARPLIEQIQDQYPFSRYAVDAELLAADLAFTEEKFEEAAAAYRSFEELHPTHPRVDYAVYRRGLAYAEVSLPADRDQTATRSAAEAFAKLLNASPGSEYAADASRRLAELRSRLAGHELYVARYYLRKKEYDAAVVRLRTLVQEYPDAPQRDEALRLALELSGRPEGSR